MESLLDYTSGIDEFDEGEGLRASENPNRVDQSPEVHFDADPISGRTEENTSQIPRKREERRTHVNVRDTVVSNDNDNSQQTDQFQRLSEKIEAVRSELSLAQTENELLRTQIAKNKPKPSTDATPKPHQKPPQKAKISTKNGTKRHDHH